MFNKSKSPAPSIPPLPDLPSPPSAPVAPDAAPVAAAPRPATPQRSLSVVSADLSFTGDLKGNGDLQIDGQVKGEVKVGRLIVGETGAVEGNIVAEYVEVRGRVVGAVIGKQVKLVSTAYLDGDITAEQLSIDIGAYFQGRVLQSRRDVPAAPAPAPVAAPIAAAPIVAPAPQAAPAIQPTTFTAPAAPAPAAPASPAASAQSALESALDAVPLRPL